MTIRTMQDAARAAVTQPQTEGPRGTGLRGSRRISLRPSPARISSADNQAMTALFARFTVVWPWFGHDWSTQELRQVARTEWAGELRGHDRDVLSAAFRHAKQIYRDRAPTLPQFAQLCALEERRRADQDAPMRLPEPVESRRQRQLAGRRKMQAAFRRGLRGSPILSRLERRWCVVTAVASHRLGLPSEQRVAVGRLAGLDVIASQSHVQE